jgi:hypothetical protein
MLPKDSGCIGIIDRTWSFFCLLASFYSSLVFFCGHARPADRVACHPLQSATEILDVESWFLASSLTAVVGLGMPTVRFGIPFTTLKRRFYITNGTAPGSNPTAHRTAPRSRPTDPERRKPTRRPYIPSNSRWSARNLKQKRHKLERQGPSIAAEISCSMYPQRYRWSYGHSSDATCMSRRNGQDDQKGYSRANNHARVEVSRTLATTLHRRTTTVRIILPGWRRSNNYAELFESQGG